jgi:hypothetical protein
VPRFQEKTKARRSEHTNFQKSLKGVAGSAQHELAKFEKKLTFFLFCEIIHSAIEYATVFLCRSAVMEKIGWVATGGHRFSSGDDQVNVFFLFLFLAFPSLIFSLPLSFFQTSLMAFASHHLLFCFASIWLNI